MKILLIKTSSLGDLVQTFPVVGYLKNRFPQADIDWVVEGPFSTLIAAHPSIHRTLVVDTKTWRKNLLALSTWKQLFTFRRELQQSPYDVTFDLQGNIKSGLILSQVASKHKVGFARHSVPEWPNLLFTNRKYDIPCRANVRADYLSVVKQHFNDRQPYQDGGVFLQTSTSEHSQVEKLLAHPQLQLPCRVLVACGSAWPNKELPLDLFQSVLKGVQQHLNCAFIFTFGSPSEQKQAEELAKHFSQCSIVAPKLSLPALQALMYRLDLVIGMDSLPLHLAGTTSKPVFGFFGPSLASKYQPLDSGFFQGSCPYGRTFTKRCPILRTCATGACLRQNNPQDLLQAFLHWWSNKA